MAFPLPSLPFHLHGESKRLAGQLPESRFWIGGGCGFSFEAQGGLKVFPLGIRHSRAFLEQHRGVWLPGEEDTITSEDDLGRG